MAVANPVKVIATFRFDEYGYEGWYAKMRMNPPAYVYDQFIAEEPESELAGLSQILQEWNFAFDDGTPAPHPKDLDLDGYRDMKKKLPYQIWNALMHEFFEEFRRPVKVPKELGENSGNISTINGRAQSVG